MIGVQQLICSIQVVGGGAYTGWIAVSLPTDRRCLPLLDHLVRLGRMRAQDALAPLRLRPRHLVALTVMRQHGSGTQQALAAALRVDRTNLVGLLNELESDGLIVRRRSAEDRRRHIVELTEQGAQRLAEAESALSGLEDELLSALDPAERETLYALLAQATASHAVGCAAATSGDACVTDGGC
jgi:DNA-binding MarR family transcriptional regulator